MMTVYTKSYPPPQVDIGEILRYAGERGDGKELLPIVNESISEAWDKLTYKLSYTVLPIEFTDSGIELGGVISLNSKGLIKHLCGCDFAIVFAATVGIGIDRLIKKSGVSSPLRALVFQALGTERIEALCDMFCEDLRLDYTNITSRFSPGYSDLSLDYQREIFKVLSCEKNIGLSLNDSLLMSPSKSVSAIVGIKKQI